jgi:hypothetical protein
MRCLSFALAAALLALPALHAEEPAAKAESEAENGFQEITPAQEAGVLRALEWLAKSQSSDGSFGAKDSQSYTMAMTGLSGLAFLSAGHSPGRGKYGGNVTRAIEYILKKQNAEGLLSSGNDGRSMYGHGFAMTFLGEVYGMDPDGALGARIRDCLNRAVKLTQRAQSKRGGWYYSPDSQNDEGSVTVTQAQALRSARNAGIDVSEKCLTDAINYVKACQNSDGGIRYSLESGQSSSVALTAAGAEVFMMAGRYGQDETTRACDFLKKNLDPRRTAGYHDFYTNFYGSQAMFQIGGAHWERYFGVMRDRLLKSQTANGSWNGDTGPTYCTAIAVLILSLPNRYLPIFQK